MKQIFNLIKTKVNKIADIQNCGEEDCYPWKKEECRGCANRRVSVKAVLKIINEAEAKWEKDCCEWLKPKGSRCCTGCHNECGIYIEHEKVKQFNLCPICGKRIKISEVE